MSGAWTFRNTRVPVTFLFENLDAGATVTEFVDWSWAMLTVRERLQRMWT